MTDEEKLRKAYQISERRKNPNIKSEPKHLKKKMSWLNKISIQIISSICIFGLVYFIDQNHILAFDKIKPYIQQDTNFTQIYNEINSKIQNITEQTQMNTNEIVNELQLNETISEIQTNELSTEEIAKEKPKPEETPSLGGGDDGATPSVEELDDVSYIKKYATFIKPVEGVISSPYGDREPTSIVSAHHEGTDIAANLGTDIIASMEGDVTEVSTEGDYGKHIKIKNGEITTLYAHCSKLCVNEGEHITQGQKIAEVGSTGRSTGPHLHFEIRRNNVTVNPEDILSLQ